MMNLPVTYIYTHDSVEIGYDGPTHEPVEQLSMLRTIPNFITFNFSNTPIPSKCGSITSNKTISGFLVDIKSIASSPSFAIATISISS